VTAGRVSSRIYFALFEIFKQAGMGFLSLSGIFLSVPAFLKSGSR
jgi:hypothetical protein